MNTAVSLQVLDYIVVAFILLVSLSIGILFAVKDFRNVTRVDYLFGGRRLSILPVSLSLFATAMGPAAYIGLTVDVYHFGVMAPTVFLGYTAGYFTAAFTFVPLLYPLHLPSAYEYLQLRFDSTVVRLLILVLGMLQLVCFVAIALLVPALSLQAGAGVPLWLSIGLLGFIATVYTAIGGIKSVVWTDSFQSLLMIFGPVTIIIKGISAAGGGSSAWSIIQAGGRASFNEFDLDPRTRITWWGSLIGGIFLSFSCIFNQPTLQRISSMKFVSDAKKSFCINGVIYVVHSTLLIGLSLSMYAYFAYIRCDPFQAGYISNRNQMSVYFVMHALRDLPGIGGVYIATIFSASLSTISSGINSLAANTTEDFLKHPLKNVAEKNATFITKVIVFGYGLLVIGMAYGAIPFSGQLVPLVVGGLGAWGGPIVGTFLLGVLCPWANKYGAVSGGVIALVFNMWMAIGNYFYGRKFRSLPIPISDSCFGNSTSFTYASTTRTHFNNSALVTQTAAISTSTGRKDPFSFGFLLYDISFFWYAPIGAFICLTLGMAISFITRRYCKTVPEQRLLLPFVRRFCQEESSHLNCEKDLEVTESMI